MFLYVDESGRDSYDPSSPFILVLLRFTSRETLDQFRTAVRRERKRFERFLHRTGILAKEDRLAFLSGATKKSNPGIVQYPAECYRFFEQLAAIFDGGQRAQLHILNFERRRGQTLPGDRPPHADSVLHTTRDKLAKMRIYTNLLGDLLSSIRAFPPMVVPDSASESGAGEKMAKRAVLVLDKSDGDAMQYPQFRQEARRVRKAFSQRCFAVLKRKRKLRGAVLRVWFNDDRNDFCLQLVDVISNFCFQARRLGIGITHARPDPTVFRNIAPLGGKSAWTKEEWMRAFHLLEPSIDQWKFRFVQFRPTRKLDTPARRMAHRNPPRP